MGEGKGTMPPLLTAAEVGEQLGCSADHVVTLYRRGRIAAVVIAADPPGEAPHRRGPRGLRFRPEDVARFIDANLDVRGPAPAAAESTVTVPDLQILYGKGGRPRR
jgi:hypothetical protein